MVEIIDNNNTSMARSGARACSPCLYCSLYCKSDLELPPLFFVMESIPVPLFFLFPWFVFFFNFSASPSYIPFVYLWSAGEQNWYAVA